jgi:hypothetical protein
VLNPSDFVQPCPGNFFHTSLPTGGEGAGLQQRHRGGGGAGRVADPQIRIISGFNRVSGSGFGSRRAKMAYKSRKKLINFML